MNKDVQTAVRFPSAIIRRLDAVAKKMTSDRRGLTVTRAALIRVMVMECLEQFEKEGKKL